MGLQDSLAVFRRESLVHPVRFQHGQKSGVLHVINARELSQDERIRTIHLAVFPAPERRSSDGARRVFSLNQTRQGLVTERSVSPLM